MTLPTPLVAVCGSATRVPDEPKAIPESPLGLLGLCQPDGFRAMVIKFPTWVSENFLSQIERLRLLGLPTTL